MGEIIKKYIPAIILLLVVALVWAGLAFVFDTSEKELNIEESIYKTPLGKTFSKEDLDEVYEKTSQKMPISPREFLNLKKED
ncbi:MAG TPA: hypothetical protein PLG47_03605 [Candidatus Dojkabacteria bacterium]|jgi:hypothetical protein|nr:hypothetical protein [Candidatus Dojkabacteria bacterium]